VVQSFRGPFDKGEKPFASGRNVRTVLNVVRLYGVCVQDEWKPTPTLTLNYGLRFDMVEEFTHESQVSPRVNLVWKPAEGTTMHIGYARYFVPPPFEAVSSTSIGNFAGTTAAPEVTQAG
jgi:outer membrane receptor for ferrienterochelin and colicin